MTAPAPIDHLDFTPACGGVLNGAPCPRPATFTGIRLHADGTRCGGLPMCTLHRHAYGQPGRLCGEHRCLVFWQWERLGVGA